MALDLTGMSSGIESGFNMGMRLFDAQRQQDQDKQRAADRATMLQQRAEDRAYQRERDAMADQRLARQDAETAADRQMRLADADLADVKTQAQAAIANYGGWDAMPDDVRGDLVRKTEAARDARTTARRAYAQPFVDQQRKQAGETWSRIQAGQLNIDDLSPGDLAHTITVQAGRPLSDFMQGPKGEPSPIQQAALDMQAGAQTGNADLAVKGANVLFSRELHTGVGDRIADGSVIRSKQIEQLVPHPQDPSRVVPIVRVTVERPDGAKASYLAPITENRSADPNDNVQSISIADAFDRAGQASTLSGYLNTPDVRAKLEEGQKATGKDSDRFLEAMGYLGVSKPKRKVTREHVDTGTSILERTVDAETGEVISEGRIGKTQFAPRTSPTEFDRLVAQGLRDGIITPERAAEMRRARAESLSGLDTSSGKSADEKLVDRLEKEGTITADEAKARRRELALDPKGKKGSEGATKVSEAKDALALIEQARVQLEGGATGSGAGMLLDKTAAFFGSSTKGAMGAARLKAIEGALVAKMPKMSGPQSDKDVATYKQMAAVVGDESVPVETRLAALQTVEEIQRRYAGDEFGGSTALDGYKTQTIDVQAPQSGTGLTRTSGRGRGSSSTSTVRLVVPAGYDGTADLDRARQAISSGADPELVIRKLAASGYDTEQLRKALGK